MPLAEYRIDTSDPTSPKVEINGVPVVGYRRISVDVGAGDVPVVFVELLGSGVFEGEGVVQVKSDVEPDLREALLAFFDNLDPQELERAMLARQGGLGGESTGEAALAVLKEWSGGDDDGS